MTPLNGELHGRQGESISALAYTNDPTTAASNSAVPTASATIRRLRLAFIAITRAAFA